MPVLDAVVADIRAEAPDHIALTGDLVNVGYPPEFPLAAQRLLPLGSPDDVSIVPGNHDAYVAGSLEGMFRVFAPFMRADDCARHGNGAGSVSKPVFPYLRIRKNIALIGVNTGVPTWPFLATGKMGVEQAGRLADILRETAEKGLFRVVMIHHPPLRKGAKFGRGLDDSKRFEAILRERGAELVLHGHNHVFSLNYAAGPMASVPILGVGSASAVPGTAHHRAEYNLIRINLADANPLTIERRRVRPDNFALETIERIVIKHTGH